MTREHFIKLHLLALERSRVVFANFPEVYVVPYTKKELKNVYGISKEVLDTMPRVTKKNFRYLELDLDNKLGGQPLLGICKLKRFGWKMEIDDVPAELTLMLLSEDVAKVKLYSSLELATHSKPQSMSERMNVTISHYMSNAEKFTYEQHVEFIEKCECIYTLDQIRSLFASSSYTGYLSAYIW